MIPNVVLIMELAEKEGALTEEYKPVETGVRKSGPEKSERHEVHRLSLPAPHSGAPGVRGGADAQRIVVQLPPTPKHSSSRTRFWGHALQFVGVSGE